MVNEGGRERRASDGWVQWVKVRREVSSKRWSDGKLMCCFTDVDRVRMYIFFLYVGAYLHRRNAACSI